MQPTVSRISPSYERQVSIDAPPETVFEALATIDGIASWWSPASGDPEAGGELRPVHPGGVELVLRVAIADRPERVEWDVVEYPLDPEWVGTRIVFALRPYDASGTTLDFTHEGLVPDLECYGKCRRGWDWFLDSLRTHVERGAGRPLVP